MSQMRALRLDQSRMWWFGELGLGLMLRCSIAVAAWLEIQGRWVPAVLVRATAGWDPACSTARSENGHERGEYTKCSKPEALCQDKYAVKCCFGSRQRVGGRTPGTAASTLRMG